MHIYICNTRCITYLRCQTRYLAITIAQDTNLRSTTSFVYLTALQLINNNAISQTVYRKYESYYTLYRWKVQPYPTLNSVFCAWCSSLIFCSSNLGTICDVPTKFLLNMCSRFEIITKNSNNPPSEMNNNRKRCGNVTTSMTTMPFCYLLRFWYRLTIQ